MSGDMPATMDPDERALRADLVGGAFLNGVTRRRWRLVAVEWPHVMVAIAAAERANAPSEHVLRFDCSGYPHNPPTARPWDVNADAPLAPERWPGGRQRVEGAFNPNWRADALYIPCDRLAIEGHDGWRTQHPYAIWSPDKDLTHYLRIVHDLLNSRDYTGLRGP